MDFRHEAANALTRAKHELATNDDHRLRYAALELRMAMESITYDRAAAYKEGFPRSEYSTWQPKKVLTVLLELDASADRPVAIAVGLQDAPNEPAKEMHSLGTDTPLNMASLKRHYDALGSYLHFPTLKQIEESGSANFGRLRERCELILIDLQKVLDSPVWNAIFWQGSDVECARCGGSVRCRTALGDEQTAPKKVNCQQCGAPYLATPEGTDSVRFTPMETAFECQHCGATTHLWDDNVKLGTLFRCGVCDGRHQIRLGICAMEPKVAQGDTGSSS